jgi:opacity protein-like surface antigen
MRKQLFISVAALAVSVAGPAAAADMAVPAAAPFAARFNWTSCYLGGHVGGGFAQRDITDPVQLVQDSFLGAGSTVGTTTASLSPNGVVIGGQIGCDYQFASSWVIGIEGSASGSTIKGSTNVILPLGAPDIALVKANTDFLSSVTGRVGYAFDNVLVYGRGGVALAGDKYDVIGSFTLPPAMPFSFEGLDLRAGWVAGGGVEWAFSRHWSANLEYDYYQFGHNSVLMSDSINGFVGNVDVKQSIQVVKLGLNFHIWGTGL